MELIVLFHFVILCVLLRDPLWFNDLLLPQRDSKVFTKAH
jgi:hypothetical protein